MDFGEALRCLKEGSRVCREGWNGVGMYLYLVKGTKLHKDQLRNEAANHVGGDNELKRSDVVTINSHIDMKSADGSIVVGWLASQTDMLSNDWVEL